MNADQPLIPHSLPIQRRQWKIIPNLINLRNHGSKTQRAAPLRKPVRAASAAHPSLKENPSVLAPTSSVKVAGCQDSVFIVLHITVYSPSIFLRADFASLHLVLSVYASSGSVSRRTRFRKAAGARIISVGSCARSSCPAASFSFIKSSKSLSRLTRYCASAAIAKFK